MNEQDTKERPRLDQYVLTKLEGLSRSSVAKLIGTGQVLVNNQAKLKSGYRLKPGDKVKINAQAELSKAVPVIDLSVLYEDADCVVINKPVGLLTHSKGAFNPEPTVATWLSTRANKLEAGDRAGIVHRLDRLTSGVMIAAKSTDALSWLQKQFSQRKTKKTYIAIVSGRLANQEAIIDMPIERNPKKPQTFRVGPNGKVATTAYKVLSTSKAYSLIELKPTTGRTHQLRVHLSKLGHPIVGDQLYGGVEADRLYLHALSLEITLPNRQRQTFTVDLPKEFTGFMKDNT